MTSLEARTGASLHTDFATAPSKYTLSNYYMDSAQKVSGSVDARSVRFLRHARKPRTPLSRCTVSMQPIFWIASYGE